ncbi:uncharacterized protein LOC143915346 [Arctopsyche grandis]|uniref:uncharacterized protein LOC143915346 n=1 Tax=Arctopsyche grandis TaxID=121162 RepID=UPI00406D8B29
MSKFLVWCIFFSLGVLVSGVPLNRAEWKNYYHGAHEQKDHDKCGFNGHDHRNHFQNDFKAQKYFEIEPQPPSPGVKEAKVKELESVLLGYDFGGANALGPFEDSYNPTNYQHKKTYNF